MTKYSLRDTFDFIDSVKNINVSERQMISLDVASLFTSIPLTETICFICEYIETNNLEVPLLINYLKELLRCTSNIQFKFNEQFKVQKDGVAMGSPLGPLLADCFMASLENNIFDPLICQLHLYKRYVDDTFIICDEKCDLDSLLKTFNAEHSSIRFTLERESNNSIPFLDVLHTRRHNCTIQRSIYRKPTWTGHFINFQNFVPLIRKRNLERTLCSRIRKICSEDMVEKALNLLRETLLENGYPPRFIEKNMKEKPPVSNITTVPKKTLLMNLAFKDDIAAEILRNRLSKSLKKTFPTATLRITFSCKQLIQSNAKDKIPLFTTSMCIYQFTCSCGAKYIGRTQRQVHKRILEHCPAWV
uniref:Reverse transcriptase domain-containing protein n=1 Tax=Trichobilharzia regenti TaxID=157069 RepID=A0AA85JCM4_TRIRE|nr:unnamed protein product [Trichobilharzia regenti]